MRIWKRVISLMLVLVMSLSMCVEAYAVSENEVDNNSTDIIKSYINLAAGKSTIDGGADISYTKDQIRFLGVYISNYFVPFGTEFGDAQSDDTDSTMESVKDALQAGLNFSDTYAEVFAEQLIGLARSSTKSLVMAGSTKDVAESQDDFIIPTKHIINATYFNFLYTMFGKADEIISTLEGGKLKEKLDAGELKSGYWGYMNGGDFIPMFDFKITSSQGETPSQVAFTKCMEAMPDNKGYGWNVWDIIESEVSGGDLRDDLSDEEYRKLSTIGMEMKVDCFGDILVCGLQHQLIAVPGAMNPYTWVTVSSGGEDLLQPGESYNLVNVPSMSIADLGIDNPRSLFSSVGVSDKNTVTDGDGNVVQGGGSSTSTSYVLWSPDSSYGTNAIGGISDTLHEDKADEYKKDLQNAFHYILSYADSGDWSYEDWQVSITKEKGIVAIAPLGAWVSIDVGKLSKDYKYSDKDKHDKLEEYFKIIKNGYSSGGIITGVSYDGCNRDEVIEVIGKAQKTASKDFSDSSTSQETDVNTGDTNVRLKSMVPKFCLSFSDYNLKVYRGTSETDLDQDWLPGKSKQYKEAIPKAISNYEEVYPNDKSVSKFYLNGDNIKGPSFDLAGTSNIYLNDAIVMIDNLGAYGFDSGSGAVEDYRAFPVINYLNEDGTSIDPTADEVFSYGDSNTFAAGYSNIEDGKLSDPKSVSEQTAVSLYVTYVFSSLYENTDESKAETIGRIGFRMNSSNLPEIPNEPLDISDAAKSDLILTSIRDWLYYLLHPTDGLNYVRILITNKVNAFLVGWHNDMLGTYGVGNTLGTTRYRNTTGYVTTPDLSEIEWTNSLINFYNSSIPFLIVVMIVTMVLAYVTGIFSMQKSLFGVLIFVIFLMMPVNLINNIVNTGNRISERIYGEKFTYWALVQQESYASSIDAKAEGDTYSNYLRELYAQNSNVYSNQGSESIVLKWQAPKKMTSLMFESDDSYKSLSEEGKQMLNQYLGTAMTGESYLDEDSVYLYRSYIDISNYARYIYRGIDQGIRNSNKTFTNESKANYYNSLKKALDNIDTNYTLDRTKGYTNTNDDGDSLDSGIKIQVPLSSGFVNDILPQYGTVKDSKINEFMGLSPDLFNFSIPVFNKGGKEIKEYVLEAVDDGTTGSEERRRLLEGEIGNYTDADFVGLAAYSLYSENVFYYFSWDLYDLGMQPSASTNTGYKSLLLGENNAGFFYNTKGNGELKDFMDLKSLFTYIIPYLKQCNDIVHEWDDVYGVFIYDGVPTEEGHWDDEAISSSPEMKQKYWHNINVARLYSIYTPWVDIMYDCEYSKGEYINALGEKYYVENPIDPASYPEERPMIFSESEMRDYGLGEGDLTKVERLILDCNRGMEERMYELLNYFNFSDVTLNTAAAMNCAFEFNNTFSENGIFTSNHNIYPQAFELSDFSYDAFLRFILSNSTGESMNTNEDFYANVVKKSSLTTPMVMILLDIISMYILPALKIFFLIGVFLSTIFIIICTAFRVDSENKFIKKVIYGIVTPMVQFLLITVGFAYAISLFMGVGNNAVTQSKNVSIKMGSPVTVMIAMILINFIVIYLYYKVIKVVLNNVKHYGSMVFNFMSGVAGATLGMVAGATVGRIMSSKDSSRFSGGGSSHNSEGSEGSSDSSKGSGVSSERAIRRGNNTQGVPDAEDRNESTRRNDTRRDAIHQDRHEEKPSEEKKENLNDKIKKGLDKVNSNESNEDEAKSEPRESMSSSFRRKMKNIKDIGTNADKFNK